MNETTTITPVTAEQFSEILDADPLPEEIKQNDDGSLYLPISIVQNKMDKIFGHSWSWSFERETMGKTGATGVGTVHYTHPVTGQYIHRTGTAAINFEGQMRLDFPRLDAQTFLNASKKIGRCFGRDLNRNIEDAPAPKVMVESNPEIDREFEDTKYRLLDIQDKSEAEKYLQSTSFKYHTELKQIVSSKK